MNGYEQQYLDGFCRDSVRAESVRSHIGNKAAADWRGADETSRYPEYLRGKGEQGEREVQYQEVCNRYGNPGMNCGHGYRYKDTEEPGCMEGFFENNMNMFPESQKSYVKAPELSKTVCRNDFSQYPLAMAYIPMQQWSNPYQMETGFSRGTIFPELDLAFLAGRCQ